MEGFELGPLAAGTRNGLVGIVALRLTLLLFPLLALLWCVVLPAAALGADVDSCDPPPPRLEVRGVRRDTTGPPFTSAAAGANVEFVELCGVVVTRRIGAKFAFFGDSGGAGGAPAVTV